MVAQSQILGPRDLESETGYAADLESETGYAADLECYYIIFPRIGGIAFFRSLMTPLFNFTYGRKELRDFEFYRLRLDSRHYAYFISCDIIDDLELSLEHALSIKVKDLVSDSGLLEKCKFVYRKIGWNDCMYVICDKRKWIVTNASACRANA